MQYSGPVLSFAWMVLLFIVYKFPTTDVDRKVDGYASPSPCWPLALPKPSCSVIH